jgi:hypothetical protein
MSSQTHKALLRFDTDPPLAVEIEFHMQERKLVLNFPDIDIRKRSEKERAVAIVDVVHSMLERSRVSTIVEPPTPDRKKVASGEPYTFTMHQPKEQKGPKLDIKSFARAMEAIEEIQLRVAYAEGIQRQIEAIKKYNREIVSKSFGRKPSTSPKQVTQDMRAASYAARVSPLESMVLGQIVAFNKLTSEAHAPAGLDAIGLAPKLAKVCKKAFKDVLDPNKNPSNDRLDILMEGRLQLALANNDVKPEHVTFLAKDIASTVYEYMMKGHSEATGIAY